MNWMLAAAVNHCPPKAPSRCNPSDLSDQAGPPLEVIMSHYQRLLLIMRPMLHQAVALEQAGALARSEIGRAHV